MPQHEAAHPGRQQFTFTLDDVQFAESGDPNDRGYILRGHAAVFDRLSHDLGGYRTKIAKGAFSSVLDQAPDVHLVWDHDTRYTLARTKNGTLDLREDPMGLHVYARVAPTSYAQDLAVLMRRGDVDQMSFACNIGQDTWTEDTNGDITRTIYSVDGLFDVTVCAQGAFPQTDSKLLASAIEAGRIKRPSGGVGDALEASGATEVGDAPEASGPDTVEPPAAAGREIARLKAHARSRLVITTRKG